MFGGFFGNNQSSVVSQFNPLDLSPTYWFDAAQGVTESAGLISAWSDISGNGNDVIQTTGSRQPTYLKIGLNGLPSVLFNGVNTALFRSSMNLGANAVNTVTIVASINDFSNQFLINYGSTSYRNFTMQINANTRVLGYQVQNAGSGLYEDWISATKIPSAAVFTMRTDTSASVGSQYRLWINGTEISSVSVGTIFSLNSPQKFIMGNRADPDNVSVKGSFSELAFYSNATTDQQAQFDSYLMTKYEI